MPALILILRIVLAVLCSAFAVAALVWTSLVHGLAENGPQYYPWSPEDRYVDLIDALGGFALLLAIVVPGGLVLLGSGLKTRGRGAALTALGVLAALVPAIVPVLLPRYEVGRHPILEPATSAWPQACFVYVREYAQEDPGGAPRDEKAGPELCLELEDGPDGVGPAEPLPGDLHGDLAEELNRDGVEPQDDVGEVDTAGLDVAESAWGEDIDERISVRPPPSPPRLRGSGRSILRQTEQIVRVCGLRTGTFIGCDGAALGVQYGTEVGLPLVVVTARRYDIYVTEQPRNAPMRRLHLSGTARRPGRIRVL